VGVKRQGRETDHLPLSSAEVQTAGTVSSLPSKFSWLSAYLIKLKDIFTFYSLSHLCDEFRETRKNTKFWREKLSVSDFLTNSEDNIKMYGSYNLFWVLCRCET
jgi:hypothetical protein